MLGNFHKKLISRGVVLLLAGVRGHVAHSLIRFNFHTAIGVDNVFFTVADAVEEAKRRLKEQGDSFKIPEAEEPRVTLVELFREGGLARLRREVPNPFKRKFQNPFRRQRQQPESQVQGDTLEMNV